MGRPLHPEAFQFIEDTLRRLPLRRRVVEFGGRDANGSIRPLFSGATSYVSVDAAAGAGVDVVADAAAFRPMELPDTVVCCETLEHAIDPRAICLNAGKILAPGGFLVLTAATDPRAPHSAVDGGPLRQGENYRNVDPKDLDSWLKDSGFAHRQIETTSRGDVYAVAAKLSDGGLVPRPLKLYAVTVTLDGLEHTQALVEAIRAASIPLRLIVIDNGSSDGTREWLSALHGAGQVVVLNEGNAGVASAWNQGMRIAIANGADAILVCNNDTAPFPGTIERLSALVASGCTFVTGTEVPYETPASEVSPPRRGDPLFLSPDFALFLVGVPAIMALARRDAATAATLVTDFGFFDTRYFPAYFEDNDYHLRLSAAGIPAVRDPAAMFRHRRSLTIRTHPELARLSGQQWSANRLRFESKQRDLASGSRPNSDLSAAATKRITVGDALAWSRDAFDGDRTRTLHDASEIRHSSAEMATGAGSGIVGVNTKTLEASDGAVATGEVVAGSFRNGPRRLRILWVSNAPWLASGYGTQTKLIVPRLRQLGHTVFVHCNAGLEFGALHWEGIPCLPRGILPFGQDMIRPHAEFARADIVVTLFDIWAMDPACMEGLRWCPLFPVDHEPLPQAFRERLGRSWDPIVFSSFGKRMCSDASIDARCIPHAVDTCVFRPMERGAARRETRLPAAAFIVGMVAANSEPVSRKSFPESFAAFARFRARHPEAFLYVHSTTGEGHNHNGVNLVELAKSVGIEDAVRFLEPYAAFMGCPQSYVAALYNSFDVLLSPSRAEGFGLPIIEAQACGCPVIVGDWTSMGELCFAGRKISTQDSDPFWTPLCSWQRIPKIGAIANALEEAYEELCERRSIVSATARREVLRYDVERVVAESWVPFLEHAAERIAREEADAGRIAGSNGHIVSTPSTVKS